MSVLDLVGAAYDQAAKPVQQGAAELAAALFHQSDGFMPVGVGQQNAQVEQGNAVESMLAQRPEQEMGGRE